MKCPKCGYNSFEFLDSCKKCNSDLRSYKESRGIKPLILASASATAVESEEVTELTEVVQAHDVSSPESDTFRWDAPEEPAAAASAVAAPSFDLDFGAAESEDFCFEPAPPAQNAGAPTVGEFTFEEAAPPAASATPAFDDESFANLLETTGTDVPKPPVGGGVTAKMEDFATAFPAETQAPPAPGQTDAGTREFEMDFFLQESGEEKSAEKAQEEKPAKTALQEMELDDFASIFGEPVEGEKKP